MREIRWDARSQRWRERPRKIWSGAVLAMLTKACLAVSLGIGLRRWVPRDGLRWVSVTICLVMALLAAFRIEL